MLWFDLLKILYLAVMLGVSVHFLLRRDWGALLCRVGLHHDKTITVYGPRRGLSKCIRCGRTVEFDFMPNDERID